MNKKQIIITSTILILVIIILLILFGCEKKYNITFNTDGGSQISDIKISKDKTLNLKETPTKEGYIFAGFTDQDGNIVTSNYTVNKDTKLTANWISKDENIVTISYVVNDKNENIIIKKGSSLKSITEPKKEGYIFAGWINEEGKIVNENLIVNENIKLKSRWIKSSDKIVTININTDGGNNIKSIINVIGSNIVLPINPTKEGYLFDGWKFSDGSLVTSDSIVNNDLEIIAIWKKSYTCKENCKINDDGKTCTKISTTNLINVSMCPNGYTLKNGKCLNMNNKYYAINTDVSPFWKCNGNDYMYSVEDGVSAEMWCVPTVSSNLGKGCPSGYVKENNTCIKREILNCTIN